MLPMVWRYALSLITGAVSACFSINWKLGRSMSRLETEPDRVKVGLILALSACLLHHLFSLSNPSSSSIHEAPPALHIALTKSNERKWRIKSTYEWLLARSCNLGSSPGLEGMRMPRFNRMHHDIQSRSSWQQWQAVIPSLTAFNPVCPPPQGYRSRMRGKGKVRKQSSTPLLWLRHKLVL